jgi:hypothetical protein
MKRIFLALTFVVAVAGMTNADTVIVNENFDSYPSWDTDPSQTAFHAAWRPDNGDGIADFLDPTEAGFLVPNSGGFLNAPNENPPDLEGQGVTINSATHESTATFSLVPSATKWIRFGGDIFNDGPITNDSASGMRQSIGLRNDNFDRDPVAVGCQCGVNFIELGFYNTAADDPRTPEVNPTEVPNTQFQYRIALFSLLPPDNLPQPNWLSFQLDPALDTPTEPAPTGDFNDNGTVDAADYVAWRNAGPTDTLPNDLTPGVVDAQDYIDWQTNFGASSKNGIVDINDIGEGWHRFEALIKENSITVELDLYRDSINNATGEAGIDASDTWPVQLNTAAGLAGAFNSLRFGGPSGVSPNDQAVFDNITLTEIDVAAGAGGLSVATVPEPTSLALVALGMLAIAGRCRRRNG